LHLELRISPLIFEKKIVNGSNWILSGARGKLMHEKKPEFENLVALSLYVIKEKGELIETV
jgi:hypothetical protein